MKEFSLRETKILLFLINFFDGIGLAFNYPWYIFYNQQYTKTEIADFWRAHNATDHPTQLYLHTLFCETKCHYCNCISYVDKDLSNHEKYKKFLLSEIEYYGNIITKPLDTLYFGGGTFSLWNEKDMEEILIAITNHFSFKDTYTWMVELHPESTTKEKLKLLKSFGITNVMVGLQSLNKKVSEKNNRPYDEEKIKQVIEDITQMQFRKVCFDMMYNLPYESYDDLEQNLEKLVVIGEEISGRINTNLEINKWNMSYYVPYYKIGVRDNFERLKDFLGDFFELLDVKTKLVNEYTQKHFHRLFGYDREEIDSRVKNNTAILGLGYGAISYVPGVATYGFDFSYKKIKDFYDDMTYSGHGLSEKDDAIFLFLNNFRSGFSKDTMKQILQNESPEVKGHFQRLIPFLKQNQEGDIYAQVQNDEDIHMMSLCFYSYEARRKVLKDLLKKWIGLGYNTGDLEENIDTYLSLYYKKSSKY